ncbi:MAG: formylmethanofuran dehydrogenase subunit E [Litorilinea sp.]|nr:MAG: formylmethanofuran dehydrogenase subunit E [Litorilinea sp.]
MGTSQKTLEAYLQESSALHRHLCPRQVLGVRMGMWAAELLDLNLPQTDKRLLTIVETDGCFADGVAVATNCWVGRRTMRVEDYGKIAATFVDTQTGRAVRVIPCSTARQEAHTYAPEARNRWEAMLLGYQRMPVTALLTAQEVALVTPVAAIVSRAGHRVNCARCGEEIINEREVIQQGVILCRSCAGDSYYRPVETATAVPSLP